MEVLYMGSQDRVWRFSQTVQSRAREVSPREVKLGPSLKDRTKLEQQEEA